VSMSMSSPAKPVGAAARFLARFRAEFPVRVYQPEKKYNEKQKKLDLLPEI